MVDGPEYNRAEFTVDSGSGFVVKGDTDPFGIGNGHREGDVPEGDKVIPAEHKVVVTTVVGDGVGNKPLGNDLEVFDFPQYRFQVPNHFAQVLFGLGAFGVQ